MVEINYRMKNMIIQNQNQLKFFYNLQWESKRCTWTKVLKKTFWNS